MPQQTHEPQATRLAAPTQAALTERGVETPMRFAGPDVQLDTVVQAVGQGARQFRRGRPQLATGHGGLGHVQRLNLKRDKEPIRRHQHMQLVTFAQTSHGATGPRVGSLPTPPTSNDRPSRAALCPR